MKNILIWVGIVALSLQDYFKKQPVKTTRQQQFLQTGGTSQAFIEGYSDDKKILIKYFGKPQEYYDYYEDLILKWKTVSEDISIEIQTWKRGYYGIRLVDNNDKAGTIWYGVWIDEFVQKLFLWLGVYTNNEDYQKLEEIAKAGDWELALQIAKGQGLI